MMRLRILLVLGAAILATGASAQEDWPSRPIRLIVPVSAGGGHDLMARTLAFGLSQQLPQRAIVENVTGAGGLRATREVARSDPDGYTLLFTGPQHATLPFVYKNPGYDVKADFASVSLVLQYPVVLIISPSSPAKNLGEFIAMVGAAPGKYTFGSSGVGGASHIAVEGFLSRAGLDMVHVPFRGSGETSAALLSGQVDFVVDALATQLGNIREGRVRALALASKERSPALPDLPTVAETLPGFSSPLWAAVFAQAKTPTVIVTKMSNAIASTLKISEVKKRYEGLLVETVGSSPQELDRFMDEQLVINKDIIKKANIELQE
jgi:tripartite-type tricarboxylate transporter receptor subunit TctC